MRASLVLLTVAAVLCIAVAAQSLRVQFKAPNQTHYGDPYQTNCLSDEVNITVEGIDGAFCSPKCTTKACPTDVPAGVTVKPSCCLQSTTDLFCGFICTPGADQKTIDSQCGNNASCKPISGVGLCTYDQ
jgi:hypothetical protein